jgi:hypothetical protein
LLLIPENPFSIFIKKKYSLSETLSSAVGLPLALLPNFPQKKPKQNHVFSLVPRNRNFPLIISASLPKSKRMFAVKSSHSLFFKSLKSRGFDLDFKLVDYPKIALKRYGNIFMIH